MRFLLISHVLPFPGASGQQVRLRYILEAAIREFEVDFLTYAPFAERKEVEEQLASFGCRPIVLESCWPRGGPSWVARSLASRLFSLRTGMKSSNYAIGNMELSPDRIRSAIQPKDYSAVLFEYFHAVDSMPLFQRAGVPGILDMHNVLWKSVEQRLMERTAWPAWFKTAWLNRYRRQEEFSWSQFDALVAINRREYDLVRTQQRPSQKLFYAPMGTDLSLWEPLSRWADPPRLAYYGGLASQHNEAAALRCYSQIMPQIWKKFANVELWLVGSNPSDRLRRLTSDPRVKVTGFVEKVQDILGTMSLVLCPWSGTYGFRSRVVEVMALGIPVVATPEAVDGMDLESGRGIFLANSNDGLAELALKLLSAPNQLKAQGRLARSEMDRLYSLDKTYGRLIHELAAWIKERSAPFPLNLASDR